ncbi:MAG: hypothetical protein WBD40_04660 [Tepidisphaeraceae bacterium]
MPARRSLPCSLPVFVAMLWAVCPALGGPTSVTPIVGELASDGAVTFTIQHVEAQASGMTTWHEPDVSTSSVTAVSGGMTMLAAPQRGNTEPPIIAAPLPPALLSGLIGLATVYAYRRRHRLR